MYEIHIQAAAESFEQMIRNRGWSDIELCKLTKGDGTGTLIVPNSPTPRLVYVRKYSTNQLSTAYMPPGFYVPLQDGDSSIENIEVRVGKPPGDNKPTIMDAASQGGVSSIGTVSPMENMFYQALYTAQQNIATLRPRPTSPVSSDVAVDGPYFYRVPSSGSLAYFATGTVGSAIASAIGALTAGKHQLALVYLNKETGLLGIQTATAVTAVGTLPSRSEFGTSDVLAITPGLTYEMIIPLYLYYGQASVAETDLYRSWDLRALYTGVAPTGYKDLIDSPLVIGANHQMTYSRRLTISSTLTVTGLLSIIA